MGSLISGTTPGAALVAITRTSRTIVEPVQPVASDKPAPDRSFDANARKPHGSMAGALLLQLGGTQAADAPAEPDKAATKPNLDALNRVLAHYVAQSQAAARLGL